MHYTVRLSGLRTDTKRFTKEFEQRAESLMRQAAAEWLRAVILEVPVWTGFAKGSLKFADGPKGNLSRFLRVAVPITGRKSTPRWYYHPGRRKVAKTPENGGRFANYTFTTTRRVYTFTYTSSVIHYLVEEYFGRISGPWNSREAGERAWLAYFNANIGNLPSISKYNKPVPGLEMTNGQLRILGQSGE